MLNLKNVNSSIMRPMKFTHLNSFHTDLAIFYISISSFPPATTINPPLLFMYYLGCHFIIPLMALTSTLPASLSPNQSQLEFLLHHPPQAATTPPLPLSFSFLLYCSFMIPSTKSTASGSTCGRIINNKFMDNPINLNETPSRNCDYFVFLHSFSQQQNIIPVAHLSIHIGQ